MLELRPNCECCDKDLAPDALDARICSHECTFCTDRTDKVLKGQCPNCGGVLMMRPPRPAAHLSRNPGSQKRILKAGGCASTSR
ncbi:MAG: DUF1272 domain-containing protein [Gammaproteobacteria bacterium]|nr:DUF1272 domain-containing protein [Gammaproteobacteria bacterium]